MRLPVLVALGTMHGKAAAIAPPLARIGVGIIVPEGLDTDRFGTFTGEIPRAGTMRDAARAKTRAAMAATGLTTALASEGAYGPHPSVPLLVMGHELILWRDEMTGHEITEQITDDSPCFDHAEVTCPGEVEPLLARIGFPAVALVAAPAGRPGVAPVAKGIRDRESLARAIDEAVCQSPVGRARLQTDMRAHMNPRRMAMITRLAERLAARLATPCPACGAPGFGTTRIETGLPCRDCGRRTSLVRAVILSCGACHFERQGQRQDGRTHATAAECEECNP